MINMATMLREHFDAYSPDVVYKHRESIQFKNKRVSYDDFTKFLVTKELMKPVWTCKPDELSTGKVIDMKPYVCIGVADLCATLEPIQGFAHTATVDIASENCFDNIENVMDLASNLVSIDCSDESSLFNNGSLFCLYNLKHYNQSINNKTVGKIGGMLYIQSIANRELFVSNVIDLLTCQWHRIFGTHEINKNVGDAESEALLTNYFNRYYPQFGSVSYKPPMGGSDKKITDGRGLCACVTLCFLINLVQEFGDCSRKNVTNLKVSEGYLNKLLYTKACACVGHDTAGFYFQGRNLRVNVNISATVNDAMGDIENSRTYKSCVGRCVNKHFLPQRSDEIYTVNGSTYYRDEYEDLLFVDMMYGKQEWGTSSLSSTYIDTDLMRMLPFYMAMNQDDGVKYYDFDSMYETMSDALFKGDDNFIEKVVSARLSEFRVKTQNKVDTLSKEFSAITQQCDSMRDTLIIKDSSIEILKAEVESLRSQLSTYINTEDIADDSEVVNSPTEKTFEECVEFVNKYTVVCVGGHVQLENRLRELGLVNTIHVQTERELNKTAPKTDFICLSTLFCSHAMVGCISERYSNQLDTLVYYNGTNARNLVYTLYNFIVGKVGD